jgi:hypothetical protein
MIISVIAAFCTKLLEAAWLKIEGRRLITWPLLFLDFKSCVSKFENL